MRTIPLLGAALTLIVGTTTADATTISFDSLTGANGDPFIATTESGYDITAVTPDWNEAHVFGNPVPSIYTTFEGLNIIRVTLTGGGAFSLNSVDFGCGIGAAGECTGTVAGSFGGGSLFSLSTALLPNNGTFSTFLPGVSGFVIDTLFVSMDMRDSNIDNIVVTEGAAVPEPSTLAMLGLGLAGFRASRRKKTSSLKS